MKQKTFYLNLNNPISNLQEYDPVEAYKICTNLVNKYFGDGSIFHKKAKLADENGNEKIVNMLEIKVITDKDHSDFLDVLKIIYNQNNMLVETN